MPIAVLSIDLKAQLANLQSGMDKAVRLAEKDSARMEHAFEKVRGAAVGIGAALAGALSVREVTDWIKGSIDAADAAAKQARQVGLLTEEITALNYAADLSGISQEELTTALVKLSKTAFDADTGLKSAADTFTQLGIKVRDTDGKLKSGGALLDEIADRFAALPDGIDKTALSTELFGRAGAKLINLLAGGSAALADMKREAEDLGLVIGSDLAESSEKLNDNIARLQKNLDGLGNSIAARVVPVLNEMVDRVLAAQKTFGSFGEFLRISLRADAFDDAADGVDNYTKKVADLSTELAALKASGGLIDSLQISGKQKEIDDARKLLEFYQRVASAGGNLGPGAGRGSVVPPFAVIDQSTLNPIAPTKKPAPFKPTDFSYLGSGTFADLGISEDLRSGLEAALKAIDSTDVEKVRALKEQLAELISLKEAGIGGASTEEAIQRTIDALEEMDPAAKAAADSAARLKSILERTPSAQLEAALADITLINKAFDEGQIDAEKWAQAVRVATQGLRAANEEGAKAKSIGDDLGLTLSSAFADAVIAGKDLRDVLKGIADDVLRILLHRQVIEPLDSAIRGFDFGSFFRNLPSYDVGTDYVPRDMVAMIHKGERIIPAAQNRGDGGTVVKNSVVIQTAPGMTAQTTEQANSTGGIDTIVKIIDQRIASGISGGSSKTAKALQGTYGLSRTAGAPRRG